MNKNELMELQVKQQKILSMINKIEDNNLRLLLKETVVFYDRQIRWLKKDIKEIRNELEEMKQDLKIIVDVIHTDFDKNIIQKIDRKSCEKEILEKSLCKNCEYCYIFRTRKPYKGGLKTEYEDVYVCSYNNEKQSEVIKNCDLFSNGNPEIKYL